MLRGLLVCGILVPGIFLALSDRFWALLLYLWFALFRPQEWMYWDISALRPSLILGIILIVPALATGTIPNATHAISLSAIAFFFAALVAQTNVVVPAIGWQWLDYYFRLLIVTLLLVTLVDSPRRFRWTVLVIAGSFGFHTAKAGLSSLLGGGVRFYEGLAGAFTDNNGYAVGMVMILPLLVAVAQNTDRRWLKIAYVSAVPLTILATISTFSRGGFLGLLAAVAMFMMLQRRRGLAFVLVITLAVPLFSFMASQSGYLDRLETIRTYEEADEESAISRLHFWRVALDMAEANPLGVGLFNYEQAYDRYDFLDGLYGHKRSVHSSHFQVLAETGVIGTIAYTCAFVFAFRSAFRIRRRGKRTDIDTADARLFFSSSNALIASLTGFVVGGAFVAMALNDLLWLSFGLIAALDRISASVCLAADLASSTTTTHPLNESYRWRPTVDLPA